MPTETQASDQASAPVLIARASADSEGLAIADNQQSLGDDQAGYLTEEPPPAEFRGPDVTLIASEERMVYEYRQNGQLRMIKVIPTFGRPYYLVPHDRTRGFGDLEQAQTLVAEWVIKEF